MAIQAQVLSQWFHPFSLFLFFISLCLLIWFNWPSGKKKNINLPPSPPRLPLIGHVHLLGSLPHRSLQLLSQKYGPLMLLYLGQIPTLIVSSSEMAKEIMKTQDIIFADRPVTTASKAFLYGCKDISFAPYGEYWRQMRKHCVIELLSVKRVQSFRFVREEVIGNMVRKIKESSLTRKEVNLSDLIAAATNNIISRAALGRNLEGEKGKADYVELIKKAMELFVATSVEDVFPSLGWIDVVTGLSRIMRKTSETMLQFMDEVIEEHLVARKKSGAHDAAPTTKDFVDLLLDYEEDSRSLGVPFTRENLKAVIMDMFIAGTDTSYTTLEWAMAELSNHPNVMKRVQEEVRQVVGTKVKVEENEINEMVYLNCVIKETLRLHPPLVLNLPRVSMATTTIEGYDIPTKTRVMINAWAIGRDPKEWENCNEFIPERFENNQVDFRGQNFEFIPFGAGRRFCPGISFGMTVVEVILANLLYLFDWELPGGENKEDIDITEIFGLTVHLKFPLRLIPVSHNI